jgi:ribosomal protein L35AE/L33A
MKNRYVHGPLTAILITLALAATPASGQQKIKPIGPETSPADHPLKVFKGIERAWSRNDASGIAAFVGEGRVSIDVRGIGQRGGEFSRSQVLYLFRRMFESDQQTKFEFVKFHNLDKPDHKVFGIAYRSYKNNRSGKVYQDKVYVTLGREGPGWVVAEIKTTR